MDPFFGMNLADFVNGNRDALQALFDLVPVPVFGKDRAGHFLFCNRAFEEFIGLSRQVVIGKTLPDLVSGEDGRILAEKEAELYENPGSLIYEAEVTSRDGRGSIMRFHKTTFPDAQGGTAGLVGVVFDITKKVKLRELLEQASHVDSLTGVANWREGETLMAMELRRSLRKNLPLTLIMMDLDRFHQINETWGPGHGDEILHTIAQAAKNALRRYDLICRRGGEQFLCCLPDTRKPQGVILADRIRQKISDLAHRTPRKEIHRVTVSLGVATYPEDGLRLEALVAAAGEALQEAKSGGRNRVAAAGGEPSPSQGIAQG
jgi:diguanylate cyclase (GGDEF)-like protein/PAS domain S-box-containing protein